MVSSASRKPYATWLGQILTFLLATIALVLSATAIGFVTVPYTNLRTYLDSFSGDGTADAFTESIHRQLQQCMVVASLALACFFGGILYARNRLCSYFSLQIDAIVQELQQAKQWIVHQPNAMIAMLATTAIAVALPLPYMDEPIRYDEAHTYVNYAKPPLFMTITRYDAPNNHVLHSLLCNISLRVFGDHLWSLRIPTFVAGVLCVSLVTLWTTAMSRPPIGFLAGALLAASPTSIEHLTNARGYTLTACFFIASGLAAWVLRKNRSSLAWMVWVLSSSLSVYSVPTMVFGVWVILMWILLADFYPPPQDNANSTIPSSRWSSHLLGAFSIGLLSFLLYLPVLATNNIADLKALFASSKLTWLEIVDRLPVLTVRSFQWMVWEIPAWICVLLFVGFMASPSMGARMRRREVQHAFIAFLSLIIPLFLQRMLPPERAWYFLYPSFLMCAALGWDALLERLAPANIRTSLCVLAGLLFIGGSTWHLSKTQILHNTPRQCTFREVDEIATYLHDRAQPNEPIILVTPSSAPIIYEFQRKGWSSEHFLVPGKGQTNDHTAWLVTSHEFNQTPTDVLKELSLERLFESHQVVLNKTYSTASIYRLTAQKP